MKMNKVSVIVSFLLFIISGSAYADRQLSRNETLQLFQALTAQPRETWITAGTIDAIHQRYIASDGYFTESNVVVKFDGDRFWWGINTVPKQGQVNTRQELLNRKVAKNTNAKRIFVWDGEKFTRYFKSDKHATVTENPSNPALVRGPLTAGVIPWGHGIYTYQELSNIESVAEEIDLGNGEKKIRLVLKKSNIYEIEFVLDPSKDNAVLSWKLKYTGLPIIVQSYGNYQLFTNKWLPQNITIERYDNSKSPAALFSYDEWNFHSIDLNQPNSDSFGVIYEDDTLVELRLSGSNKSLLYHSLGRTDTDFLLQYKRAIMEDNSQAKNCATVAMEYIAAQLGKQACETELAALINRPDNKTTLYNLKQFAQELGLNCYAAKTNIQGLKSLKREQCQVILHMTGDDHYVVLGHINDKYAWIVDLESSRFHYRIDIGTFKMMWSEGIAMLISNEPLTASDAFTGLGNEQISQITGGAMVFNMKCTEVIQEPDVIFCSDPVFGLCGGLYTDFTKLWGCGEGEDGDECMGDIVIGNASLLCINDPQEPWGECITDEDWRVQYMRACDTW